MARHESMIYGIAVAMLHDVHAARDVVQQVLIRLWDEINRGRVRRDCAGWLRVVTANHCRNHLRQHARTRPRPTESFADLCTPDASPHAKRRLAEALSRIEELPPQQRQAISLLAQGLTYCQIAEAMAITEVNARKHCSLARAAILSKR